MKRFLSGALVALLVVMSATHALDQLSKKDPDGTIFGQSGDKIGFYGLSAGVLQPTGTSQAALGTTTGGVNIIAPTLTPASVAANTCAEQTFTATGVATDQMVVVNKPTAQAGLGIGGFRVNTTNRVSITFCNNTGAVITPTAGETYVVGAMGGAADGTAVLVNALRSALVTLGLIKGSA